MLSANPKLYKIALRGNEDLNSLTEWEKQRFTLWCLHETWMWEMCYKFISKELLTKHYTTEKRSIGCNFIVRLVAESGGIHTPLC